MHGTTIKKIKKTYRFSHTVLHINFFSELYTTGQNINKYEYEYARFEVFEAVYLRILFFCMTQRKG